MAATKVNLYNFNTVTLASGTVYRLVTRAPGTYYFYIINLGPGELFYRADADPTASDPQSFSLPANMADNQIPITDGIRGLGVVANQAGSISVRIVPQ